MATYQVHCVLVSGVVGRSGEDGGWGMVSDFDLVRAIAAGIDPAQPVEELVSTPLHTIRPQAGMRQAAEMMSTREITHLVVIDEELGEPMGIVSSLDVAALLARS